jgi:hypothetical protein
MRKDVNDGKVDAEIRCDGVVQTRGAKIVGPANDSSRACGEVCTQCKNAVDDRTREQ